MKIHYDTENRDLKVKAGLSLLDICLKNKIAISHSCEGMASCGTCRVIVTSNPQALPARNNQEQEMANDRKFSDEERLACQLYLKDNCSFKLPNE